MIFPPAFLDSSAWNDNQQHQHQQAHHQIAASGGGGGGGDPNHELLQPSIMGGALPEGGGGGQGQGQVGPAKPMSMAERARLARIPLPEPGLKCPRCDSTNTKFCYFNNYSLSQPRHFCRACRRYWTRGGALRNVPVGGGYRRHAKRAKPKVAASAAGTAALPPHPSAGSTTSSATACTTTTTTTTANASPAHALHGGPAGMLGGGGLSMLPPLLRLADFDAMSLGSSFSGISSMGKPASAALEAYSVGGGGAAPHPGLEQWRLHQQMQSFPFLHAMDQGPQLGPPLAMTMAAPAGMFQLGLDTTNDGARGGGGGGEDGSAGGELHVMHQAAAAKRESYPAPTRGMYGDHHHLATTAGGGAHGGYTFYSTNAATGNHLL